MTMISKRDQQSQLVEGQRFTETFPATADRIEPSISSLQADFPLCEADFLRLKNGNPKTLTAAHSILLTAAGLGLSIGGKYAEAIFNQSKVPIPKWEVYGFAIAIVIAALLYAVGLLFPNDKKKVMTDIETHFEKSPRTRHIVRENNG